MSHHSLQKHKPQLEEQSVNRYGVVVEPATRSSRAGRSYFKDKKSVSNS